MRNCRRSIRIIEALTFALALPCGISASAEAASFPHGTLDLIAETQWIAPVFHSYLGLHFQLEKGWHIYWVNPGDSGEPPRVEWRLPPGITAGEIEWPTPRRFQSSTIVDYGYEDGVLLLVPIHVDPSLLSQGSAPLGAAVKLLVCSHEMCIPAKAELSLTLPVRSARPVADPAHADLFAAARKSLPGVPRNWRLSAADTNDSFALTATRALANTATRPSPDSGRKGRLLQVTHAIFFPLEESEIDNAAEQMLSTSGLGFRLTLRKSDRLVKPLERLRGVLVVSSGDSHSGDSHSNDSTTTDQAYSIDVRIGKPAAAMSAAKDLSAMDETTLDEMKSGSAVAVDAQPSLNNLREYISPLQSLKEEPRI